jgi:hypothetical protein
VHTSKHVLFLLVFFLLVSCGDSQEPAGVADAETTSSAATATASPPTATPAPTETLPPTATSTPQPTATPEPTATPQVDLEALQDSWYTPVVLSAFSFATCQGLQEAAEHVQAGETDGFEALGELLGIAILVGSLDEALLGWQPAASQAEFGETFRDNLTALQEVVSGWFNDEITSGDIIAITEELCPQLEQTFEDTLFVANEEGLSADDLEFMLSEAAASLGEALEEIETDIDVSAPEVESTIEPATDASSIPADAEEANLGDLIEQDGYSFIVLSLEDPAQPGMLYTPEENTRLVAVEIIVGNVAGERVTVNPLNTTLLDAEGFTYQAELAGRDGQIATIDLEPGERVRGWVAFQVPDSSEPAALKYQMTYGGPLFRSALTAETAAVPAGAKIPLTATGGIDREPAGKLGETVEKGGYSLVAEAVEDPATGGMLYTAEPGMKLIAVQIAVGNESGDTVTVNPLKAVLIDSEGYVYTPELAGRDGQIAVTDIAVGERVRGWVAFEVPEGTVAESIRYQVSGYPVLELETALAE